MTQKEKGGWKYEPKSEPNPDQTYSMNNRHACMHSSSHTFHPSRILRTPLPGESVWYSCIAYNAHAYMHTIPIPSNQLLSLDQKYNAVCTQHCRVFPSPLSLTSMRLVRSLVSRVRELAMYRSDVPVSIFFFTFFGARKVLCTCM